MKIVSPPSRRRVAGAGGRAGRGSSRGPVFGEDPFLARTRHRRDDPLNSGEREKNRSTDRKRERKTTEMERDDRKTDGEKKERFERRRVLL